MRNVDPETLAVHSGPMNIPQNRASSPPLFQASSYEFEDLADIEAIYGGAKSGGIYGRYGGPNGAQFENAVAELEGAEAAVGAAAGMSAVDASIAPHVRSGDAIVATRDIYGGTFALFEAEYRARGIAVHYVDQHDLAAVAAAIDRYAPKVVYVEALTNPLLGVADLPGLAALAHAAKALLVVDATFVTPYSIRPLAYGADLVVHSVGKYMGGHGDVGAGVLAGRSELVAAARTMLVRRGATMPHFEAWLALRGLRTLALRMERHAANALAVARYIDAHPAVVATYHPSLPRHPQHALAARLYPRGTGGIVAFDLENVAAVDTFLRVLETIAIVHSLGEVASTISYPSVSSHRTMPAAERRALGIGDGTLRLSVGIESANDIIADLENAFAAVEEIAFVRRAG